MCDLDNNIWDEAAKLVVTGAEELDDDLMSILDNIPLDSLELDHDDGMTSFEDQWFTTSPHCFGPIPSNVLFFEPIPSKNHSTKSAYSSPVHTPPTNCLKIDGNPKQKPHACMLETNTACNNPRNDVNSRKSSSKDSALHVRARSKRTKPSGPTKWHFLPSIDSTFKKDFMKRVSSSSSSSSLVATTTKTCTHCKVTKTPQWREGPKGPKTLCNACGVRYRTGRLFPEYRPANSPTYRPYLHSNSHKKVIEMRNDKAKLDQLSSCNEDPM